MKLKFIKIVFFLFSTIQVFAQNIDSGQKIVSVYTSKGFAFIGFCADLKKDTINLNDFKLGAISLPVSYIKSIETCTINNTINVRLDDDRVFNGVIKKITQDSLILNQEDIGKINIPLNIIALIKKDIIGQPDKWDSDPNCTRYFFAPSSFMLKKGDGYYQNAYIMSNSVNYGITDHFTIGGGIILPALFYVTPKVGYSINDYLHFSTGIIAGGTYLSRGVGAGIGYGMLTVGTRNHHISGGIGWGSLYQNNKWRNTEKPIIALSGNTRLTKRLSLVSENWLFYVPMESVGIIKKQVVISTLGGRFVWKKLSLDLGILAPLNFKYINILLPYIDLVVKF